MAPTLRRVEDTDVSSRPLSKCSWLVVRKVSFMELGGYGNGRYMV